MNEKDRILIIEDEENFREFLYRALSREYTVDVAEDGHRALDLLSHTTYGAVLCDLRMPGISGREVIRHIRTQCDEHIILIVITGYEEEWPAADATDEQVYFYLKKGEFRPKELKKILHNGLLLQKVRNQKRQYQKELVQVNAALEKEVEKRTHDLKESEELYRNLFAQSLVGVYILQNGVIALANQKLCDILATPSDDLVGSPLSRFLDRDGEAFQEMSEGKDESRYRVQREIRIKTQDGKFRSAFHSYGPVQFRGQTVLQGTIMDITEWRQLEQQLLQQQKMESIGTLVSALAHEFNNILSTILPHAELIKLHIKNHPSVTRSADTIQKMTERASELIRQLLGVSRQSEFKRERINPNTKIRESLSLIRATLGSQIQIQLELDASVDDIEIDPNQLDQVILNLVINARDAMPKGGRLRLATNRITRHPLWMLGLKGAKGRSSVEIVAEDTGLGMDQETMSKIFDPFFTTKEPGKGSGLGLSTVYDIVKRYDGDIRVESEPGKGAIFRIIFPGVEEKLEPVHIPGDTPNYTGRKVLVADQKGEMQDLFRDILSKMNCEVLSAYNGPEALKIYNEQSGNIDLVIMDSELAKPTRYETVSKMAEINPHVRMILMKEQRKDTLPQHEPLPEYSDFYIEFLENPFNPERLSRTVKRALYR